MNYNESAFLDDGSCVWPEPDVPILGCMYSDALNYNSLATEDDGSCRYPIVPDPILGCMYLDAFNYNSNVTEDDGGHPSGIYSGFHILINTCPTLHSTAVG